MKPMLFLRGHFERFKGNALEVCQETGQASQDRRCPVNDVFFVCPPFLGVMFKEDEFILYSKIYRFKKSRFHETKHHIPLDFIGKKHCLLKDNVV